MNEDRRKVLRLALTGSAITTILANPLFETGKIALGFALILPFFIVGAIIIYFKIRTIGNFANTF